MEQIPHSNAGPGRAADVLERRHTAIDYFQIGPRKSRPGLCMDLHRSGNAGNARKSLAAKTQGRDAAQIHSTGDLGCGVFLEGQGQVFLTYAATVVGHFYQTLAAIYHLDEYPGCTCVYGVLHKFLDD